tara:strand:- start:212 stop:589 length:378 start_codon:yes stop_codon:yes gene_type:complete
MSDAREKYVEAAMFRLRGEMMEHKAIIDAYLESPLAAIKDNDYFTDIVERSKALSVAQNAYVLLQNTLTALQAPAQPAPPPQPVEEVNTEPIKEEELLEKSAAYRKSVKAPPPVKKRGRKKKGEE